MRKKHTEVQATHEPATQAAPHHQQNGGTR